MSARSPRILAFATKGVGTNEEMRLRVLLSRMGAKFLPFDRNGKGRTFLRLLSAIFHERPDLVVVEGTSWAGGLACMLARLAGRSRYVISSGDAVGPYVFAHSLLAGPLFAAYERRLCRLSDGFIGWTPYLTGRALTFGAPRAVTAAGWAPAPLSDAEAAESRQSIRQRLGIPPGAIVFGLAGALVWNPRRHYCYGLELVEAAQGCGRDDVCVLIVGDGTGLSKLRELAGQRLGKTVFLPGGVRFQDVSTYLSAMDIASLPQSLDGVGSFRYTTKISEYAAAGLPIITGRLPLAYDLDDGSIWRLPGKTPWSATYVAALAKLMNQISLPILTSARAKVERHRAEFDSTKQVERITCFLSELLEDRIERRQVTDSASSGLSPKRFPSDFTQPAEGKLSHDGSSPH